MITLLHPSRGRPQKAYATAKEWLTMAGKNVGYALSLDKDDPMLPEYANLFDGVRVCVSDNKSVVEATNVAAASAIGDIFVYLSDDFKCPANWAELISEKFEGVTDPMLLKVDDCLQKFDVPVLTIPIMNRALYQKLGYFWHPGYRSMFVDEDLYWTCHKLGALKMAPDLKFPHEHCSVGKADNDETYRRSSANWDQGKQLFRVRKMLGFPLS